MTGELLCIIPGPSVELDRKPDRVRWCFGCRAHLAHDLVILADKGWDRGESYYDPIVIRQCPRCSKDRTAFPGSIW